ncbi:MAG: 3-phosphoglycerate kinase [Candidatus Woesearchaeota archaeon]|jgi:3-phosphoglycerate kinase
MGDELASVLSFRTLKKAPVKNKRVLIRCGLDVPIFKGEVTSDARLNACADSIKYLITKGASQIVICGHLGRPRYQEPQFSLKPIVEVLEQILKRKVLFVTSYEEFTTLSKREQKSRVVLLENLRYDSGEKENTAEFAKKLAQFGDIYVNEAFSVAHRQHASVDAITRYLPGYIGLHFEHELRCLALAKDDVKRPFVVILGFAKIKDKINILKEILKSADKVLVGGAVAFTFLKAEGFEVGKSLVEEDQLDIARTLLNQYKNKIILPIDVMVAREVTATVQHAVPVTQMSSMYAGYDIGPKTIELFKQEISDAKTVFWNGPLGVFEFPPFDTATNQISEVLACAKMTSIIGGGDTASAIEHSGNIKYMTHVSTGGGASLAFFENKPLAAIKAIYKQIRD